MATTYLTSSQELSVLIAMRRRLLGMAAVASLTLVATAAGPSAETTTRAVEADIAHLEALIELNKSKKGIPGRVKATALLIAAYAQDAKNYDLRDAALKVAEAAAKKNVDAAAIAALKKPAAGAAKKDVKLAEQHKIDLHDIMHLFSASAGGGMNIEKDLRAMKKDGVKDAKLAELVGVRSAIIADFADALPPDFNAKKKKEDWVAWNKEMRDHGLALAAEASKGAKADAKKMQELAGKLDASCVKCHNTFRDD